MQVQADLVIAALKEKIADQAVENAMLRAQISVLTQSQEDKEEEQ